MSVPWLDDGDVRLFHGDALGVLGGLPSRSVDCVVTSPPYWGLRDYGIEGQLGLEASPDEFVAGMVAVFREVRRVLAPHGTCWVNLGDSYAADRTYQVRDNKHTDVGNTMASKVPVGLKPKDLVGIPWRVAFALQADGWWLRADIIWSKPNPMPESVTDRPTKAHEYVFLLTKSPRYWFDAEAVRETWADERNGASGSTASKYAHPGAMRQDGGITQPPQVSGRNVRSVWQIATQPYPEAHFATFPEELARRCILAGCPPRVCRVCGKPSERIVGVSPMEIDRSERTHSRGHTRSSGAMTKPREAQTVGWSDCGCVYGLEPDALEVVNSPTGERSGDDPTMLTGRKGLNRPRGDNEGTRPILRFQQRAIAGQLRDSPHRTEMEREAGEAFAHYLRTDTSGARPPRPRLLEAWVGRGWITVPDLPSREDGNWRPGTVLDPFIGSGTTAKVARDHSRHAIGIDLNETYLQLAARRLQQLSLLTGDAA